MNRFTYDLCLSKWAFEYKQSLDPRIALLIRQANFDLYYGPSGFEDESEYPGFTSACKQIRAALEDVPSKLFLDVDAGTWSEDEPQAEECPDCWIEDDTSCLTCHGNNYLEPFTEHLDLVERSDLVRALVGKELASYL